MFPGSVSTYVNISSGSNVKPEDNASNNIYTFLMLQFDIIEMEPGWIAEALSYLVPHATSIFI